MSDFCTENMSLFSKKVIYWDKNIRVYSILSGHRKFWSGSKRHEIDCKPEPFFPLPVFGLICSKGVSLLGLFFKYKALKKCCHFGPPLIQIGLREG